MAGAILKLCIHCQTEKPLEEMVKTASAKDGRRSMCKKCFNAYYAKRRIEKYEQVRNYERKFHRERRLRYEFGMTGKQYDDLLSAQGDKCAVCGNEPSYERLSVDHCHSTGDIRGLLCGNCNKGLGLFGDSQELLNKAISYLKKADDAGCLPNISSSKTMKNDRTPPLGRSGATGIRVEGDSFVAIYTDDGKDHRIGRFKTIDEAKAARLAYINKRYPELS